MSDTLQHTPFDGIADYVAALDTVCTAAQHTLNIFENNYKDIGFNSAARSDSLRRLLLAGPNHRLQLLAHDAQHLARYCPRIVNLLREFGHSMTIRQTPPHLRNVTEPFAVADDAHYVRRYHFDDSRGLLARNDPEGARMLNARFHEMWQASHPAPETSTLGL